MKPVGLIFAAFFLPTVAAADVKIYGELKSGVETSQTRIGGQTFSGSQISDYRSHIGIKGSYPIGGGTQALWQWQQDTPVTSSRHNSLREQFRSRKQDGESFIGVGHE